MDSCSRNYVPEDPIYQLNASVRISNMEFLRARARQRDTNISAELRRILREEAERETAARAERQGVNAGKAA